MREPCAPLALVHAEALQPRLKIVREPGGLAIGIIEDEHPDAARLAIAHCCEPNLPRNHRSVTQRLDDRIELLRRPMSEKRERDVEMIARKDPHTGQLGALPSFDLVKSVAGQAEGRKRRSRSSPSTLEADLVRLRQDSVPTSRNCRSRWSAVTVAAAHLLPLARKVEPGPHPRPVRPAHVDVYEADRLLRRPAPGSRDTSHGDSQVGAEPAPRALRHRLGRLQRYRAVLREDARGNVSPATFTASA